jgi:pyruvate formate lyase activating enzyme
MHIDPIEKKPLFHFLPGSSSYSVATAGCNLTCKNCQNWEISQQSPKSTGQGDMYPEKLVDDAISKGCKSIAYTYSEPVAYYEYVFDTARYARMRGIKNLFISNGYINEQPLRDLSKYLDAANIDLKCFSEDTYARLSGGRLKPVLNALKVLKQEGVWLEITNLIIPGWTDDLTVIREMCTWLVVNGFHDTPLHFSRFHPAYKLSGLQSTPAETLASARIIALEAGMQYVYVGNMHNHVAEDTLCPSCGKVLIGRNGYQITENNLEGDACMFCHVRIAGVWA